VDDKESATSAGTRRPGPIARRLLRQGNAAHAFLYRRGLGRKMGRLPLILLTTTGRKTGKPNTVPLGAVREGDGWVVIGSFGGADVHPSWWLNLLANPRATIQVNNQQLDVRMEEITEPDRYQRIWTEVVAHNPGYDGYTKKTARRIPLGLLLPIGR
jgi:deazaflavin-dependent oxidoreductase (nitroreductase family)